MKKLILNLDEATYERLLKHCQGDENALQEYVARILKSQTPEAEGSTPPEPSAEELEAYLKKGSSGTRSYGIKGQGW